MLKILRKFLSEFPDFHLLCSLSVTIMFVLCSQVTVIRLFIIILVSEDSMSISLQSDCSIREHCLKNI